MKYFRSYPWGFQLMLFFLMVFTFFSFGSFLVYTYFSRFSPYTLVQIGAITATSPASLITASIYVQGFLSVFIFLVPAFLFAYLAHPQPKQYLGLRKPGKNVQWLLVILVIFGAMPILQAIEGLMSNINFGPGFRAEQTANDNITNAFMQMPTFGTFLRGFLIMAIIPALGEEMFFRGVFMKFVKKRTRTMLWPVIFTAVIFSATHTNVYGYISIFLAGALLAVIYYLTGSLWCSVIAHMFFNGFQVVLSYLGSTNAAVKAFEESNSTPVWFVVGGAIVFAGSFYLLLKNKTPLPDNWTDDFPPSPPENSDWDFMANQTPQQQ